MICFFDTSAFVPLLISEPTSAACHRLWVDAQDVVASRLLYVEAAAALAQGVRMRRLTVDEESDALHELNSLWPDFNIIEPSDRLVRRAAALASFHHLRAYDAVHCATAEEINDQDLVFASGDRQMLKAGRLLGLATANPNLPDL